MNYKKKFFSENKYDNKFSIIIPSWNNLEYLKICIDSIRKNSYFNNQIIVHINEGKDGTEDYCIKEKIDYTMSGTNFGVCYSCNLAYTLAKNEYIIYINDDMYVLPDWDKFFMDEIEKIGHNYFYLSGLLIEPYCKYNTSVKANFGDSPENFQEKKLLNEYKSFFRDNKGTTVIPPNVLHRDIWALIGGFSIELHPGGNSDFDFLYKLWLIGVRDIRQLGNCLVYHFMSKSVGRLKMNRGGDQMLLKFGITKRLFLDFFIRKNISKFRYNIRYFIGRIKAIYILLFRKTYIRPQK